MVGFSLRWPDEPEELELGHGSAEPGLKLRLLGLLGVARLDLSGPEERITTFFNPLPPMHHYYVCVCLKDGAARAFIASPFLYLSSNKLPVTRVTQSHWER